MCGDQVLRTWEEHVISQEKGSRLVHYVLKDNIGNSLLAVIGRDRSVNHMLYVVSEDFLRVFGSMVTYPPGKKWQARRGVVRWLKSVVSRGGPILPKSRNPFECQVSHQSNNAQSSAEKVAGFSPAEPVTRACKRTKSCRADQIFEIRCTVLANLDSANEVVKKREPTCKILKVKPPSKGPAVSKLSVPKPQVNENIELLSQDSGIKGCWFRCKILQSSKNCLKVQYRDVMEADGAGKLEEWVPASRVATPDTMGLRCPGRTMVRPEPFEDSSSILFVVGDSVDAWWCNGWWEGIVIGYETVTKTNLQVYFPGENRFLTVARKNIRVSRDWIDSEWKHVKSKPDILSYLSSIFITRQKLPSSPVLAEAYSSATNSEVLGPKKLEEYEDDERKIPSSSASTNLKAAEELNLKKRLIISYNEDTSCRRSS